MNDIPFFQGKYRWLSNFWPCTILLDGEPYSTVEHAYQAAKTTDKKKRLLIKNTNSPGNAKKLGRHFLLRRNWDDLKVDLMRELLIQKFSDPHLKSLLLSTKNQKIVEGNNWGDIFWGISRGKGLNVLGKLLMEVRSTL